MKSWRERLSMEEEMSIRPRTLLELYGAGRVLIEQHRGILGYSEEEIDVGATFGVLRIRGRGLRLCCMSRCQVVITGHIASIGIGEGS